MVKYYCADMRVKNLGFLLQPYIYIYIYLNIIHYSNVEVLFLGRTLFTSPLLWVQKRLF